MSEGKIFGIPLVLYGLVLSIAGLILVPSFGMNAALHGRLNQMEAGLANKVDTTCKVATVSAEPVMTAEPTPEATETAKPTATVAPRTRVLPTPVATPAGE